MPPTQAMALGPHAAAVEAAVERFASQDAVRRLWDRDASLWTADRATQALIRNRLGWLTIPRVMSQHADALRQFAQEIRESGFTHAFLLGMGGSGLFSEVCHDTFGAAPNHPGLTVLDTTDPTAIRTHQRRHPLKQLLVIVSSKSGATSETTALSRYFYEAFGSVNSHPGSHCLAITDAGTPLEACAHQWPARRLFVHGPGTGADVGGRFSALTYFGLVPAALMGVDVALLLRRASEMLARCGPEVPVRVSPAAQLGAALGALASHGRDKLTLVCAPELASTGTWIEQLIAESLGKQGRGIVPLSGEPLREPSAYADDRVFVELRLTDRADEASDRRLRELEQAGHPVVRIRWDDRYDLGGEIARWGVATAMAGSLLELNPFDEPNVQESKDRTTALLDAYVREGRFLETGPRLFEDADVVVSGAAATGGLPSLAQGVSDLVRTLRPREYVALLSFLPRTPALDRALAALRERIAQRLPGHAAMLGFGPRYLHATGQLYKGGPDAAVFLLLTAEEREDLPIPGEPYTFGVLKQAQALGDFQAMQQRGRRILRVHIRGDLAGTIRRLGSALDEATAHPVG
jgi:glucose-6-phosphate isomerase